MDCTFVIPTYNRPVQLKTCLQSIADLQFDGEIEVFVVNDGGSSDLQSVIDSVSAELSVHLINTAHAGPSQARNKGAFNASGTAVAFIDDDCVLEPDWLTNMWMHFSKKPDHLLGGLTVNALKSNVYSSTSQLLVDYLHEYYVRNQHNGHFFTSNNMLVSSQQFEAVGGFSQRFTGAGGEDREFCDRWRHSGKSLSYVDTAIIRHVHELDLKGFFRQHYNYGQGALIYHQCRKERKIDFELEPLGFYWGMFTEPWRAGSSQPFATMILMGISQIANSLGIVMAKLGLANSKKPRA